MGGHRTRFCGRAAENVPLMHVPLFLKEDWGKFQNGIYVEGGRKH